MKLMLRFLRIIVYVCIIVNSCQQVPFLTLITPNVVNFTNSGGVMNITFATNATWGLSCADTWCKISPASGEGNGDNITISIECEPNATYDSRSTTITLICGELLEEITVNQDMNVGLFVSPLSFDLTNETQTIEVEVRANTEYIVEIESACQEWISISDTKSLLEEKISFDILANETFDNRIGNIFFKQTTGDLIQTVSICQKQTNGLFILTPQYNLSNERHILTVEIEANVEYDVVSEVDWIHHVSTSTKALTPSQIILQVDENNLYDSREADVLVKSKHGDLMGTITISQDEKFGILVSNESIHIDKESQTVEVDVMYNVDFDVIIPHEVYGTIIYTYNYDDNVTNTKALSIRKYRFEIAENLSYDIREVNITFKQKDGPLSGTFSIIQDATDYIGNEHEVYYVGNAGGIIDIPLIHNNDYDVLISDDWISFVETKGLTTDKLQFYISENLTNACRQATVIFRSKKTGIISTIIIQQMTLPVLGNTAANCYIIPESGNYAIPLVFGNTSKIIDNACCACVEWESYCTNESISIGSVISSVHLDNGFINISTSKPLSDGNALVSVKDANGDILWSWHLWCCRGFNPNLTSIQLNNNAGILMDRNLGATSTSPGAVQSLGLLYEWGRKDPFLNGEYISYSSSVGQTIAKSTIAWPTTIKATQETGTVEYAIAHPTTYIVGESSDDFDWHYGERVDTLWRQQTKTIYDPCPPGWRVPDGGLLNVWTSAGIGSDKVENDNINKGLIFKNLGDGVDSWYPKSGTRGCVDGELGDVGQAACYHTNSTINEYAQGMYFASKNIFHPGDYVWRDNGGAIRCLKE